MVFSSPNFATAFDTHFSDPYGRPLLIAYRIFSISSWPWDALRDRRPANSGVSSPEKVPDTFFILTPFLFPDTFFIPVRVGL